METPDNQQSLEISQDNQTSESGSSEEGKYWLRGVSADKEDVEDAGESTGEDKGSFPDAFCKIMQDPTREDWVVIPHADGAGTKSSLAYIYWKETGDASVFAGPIRDSMIMNTDDILCAGGTLGHTFFTSTIGRNKGKIPGEILKVMFQADYDFRKEMGKYGVNLYGGVGETADVGDLVRTVIIDHSGFTMMKKEDIIDNGRISAGDYIVGLASSGQVIYETDFNGGIGSNGLTNARHDMLYSKYRRKYRESFDPELLKSGLAYNGKYSLTDAVYPDPKNPDYKTTIGKLILSPTRTYMPIMMEVFKQIGTKVINGIVHCSGGGQAKILKSLDYGLCAIKSNMFEIPHLFHLIQQESGQSWEEMYKVFNMGHRLEICVPKIEDAKKIIQISESFGVRADIIGRIMLSGNSNEKNVQITMPGGVLEQPIKYSATRQHTK